MSGTDDTVSIPIHKIFLICYATGVCVGILCLFCYLSGKSDGAYKIKLELVTSGYAKYVPDDNGEPQVVMIQAPKLEQEKGK